MKSLAVKENIVHVLVQTTGIKRFKRYARIAEKDFTKFHQSERIIVPPNVILMLTG
jgi:hypothetical protein